MFQTRNLIVRIWLGNCSGPSRFVQTRKVEILRWGLCRKVFIEKRMHVLVTLNFLTMFSVHMRKHAGGKKSSCWILVGWQPNIFLKSWHKTESWSNFDHQSTLKAGRIIFFSISRACLFRCKTQVVKLLFHFPLFVSLKNKLQNATLLFRFAIATVKFVVM